MSILWSASTMNKTAIDTLRKWKKIRRTLSITVSCSYRTDTDYNYLQQSKLRMDHFQKSLPRLPIPELDKTCDRYLASQRVLLNDDEFNATKIVVEEFRSKEGQDLHNGLKELDTKNTNTSYISAPWYDMYLRDRRPVVFNHTPFMMLKDDERAEYNDPLIRSSNFVVTSSRFLKSLREGNLKPEVYHLDPKKTDNERYSKMMRLIPKSMSWYGSYLLYKAFPLDMSQFPYLFNGTRIPHPEKDEIFNDPMAKHIVVMKKGHMYMFNTLDENGNILPPNHILAHMKYILDDPVHPAEWPVGLFTTSDRDTWTLNRKMLEEAGNQEALQCIDNAQYILSLDDFTLSEPVPLIRNFLHGDGTNRWFDKCFNLVMTNNGTTGINFEHSWGDGVAVMRYVNELWDETTHNPKVHPDMEPASVYSQSAVKKIEFNLSDNIKANLRKVQETFESTVKSLDVQTLDYPKLNKEKIKYSKLSPDSFMQLAIQMAYYRAHGKTVATYESCSTSAFRHGRTETVRSATMATKKACQLFHKTDVLPSKTELMASLQECSKVHNKLTKEAAMGQGFDRHLFAMKYLANSRGQSPHLFNDIAYKNINHIILSTSTLSSPAMDIGGFGPVVEDGLGIGYGIQKDRLGYIVSAYPSKQDLNSFIQSAESVFDDLNSVIEAN